MENSVFYDSYFFPSIFLSIFDCILLTCNFSTNRIILVVFITRSEQSMQLEVILVIVLPTCVEIRTLTYNCLLFIHCDLDGELSHWQLYHILFILTTVDYLCLVFSTPV